MTPSSTWTHNEQRFPVMLLPVLAVMHRDAGMAGYVKASATGISGYGNT